MILEHIDGATTLHDYFRDNFLNLNFNKIQHIFSSIAKGILHLHSQGIAHRDIKPENVLLNFPENKISVKIIDFGFSTTKSKSTLQCGTPVFMAP